MFFSERPIRHFTFAADSFSDAMLYRNKKFIETEPNLETAETGEFDSTRKFLPINAEFRV